MAQNLANAALIGSAYLLIAVGLTMVYGLLRILHVAHAAVYTLGAFVGFTVWQAGGDLWLGLAAAAVLCGIAGVALFELVYRPILDRSRVVALIASVGIFVLAESIFQSGFFFGVQTLPFRPESHLPPLQTDLVRLNSQEVALLVATVVLIAGLLALLWRSRMGLDWRAIAQDSAMANALGIRVRQRMALNFFIGSALAGMAGVLIGSFEGRVFATMGAVPAYKAFVVVVMGGLGNVPGAIVAAYLLALLEMITIAVFGFLLPRDAIAFTILIFVLMFFPQGLFGRRL